MKYNNLRLVIIILIVVCTVAIDTSWKFFAEQSARQVARYNVDNVRNCINELILGKDQINYRYVSDDEIQKALKVCGQKMRITETGDIFAVNLQTLDFVFDPSLDCYVDGGKKLTADSECTLHKDPAVCKAVVPLLTSGYDSEPNTRAWWQFNSSREYLEWAVAPSESKGYDGFTRGGILKPHQIVIVQGIIENELWTRYSGFRIAVYLIGFLSIIINLLYAVHENMKAERLSRSMCDTE